MTGRVIAVTGGKGGVGKSTTTINLGVSLRMDGYSVVLVDADVEMPNLMEMLGLEADKTIHDVLSGFATTNEALVELGDGFGAIPGDSALSGYGTIEPERLHNVVETLAEAYDCILLDTGAGLSYDDLFPIALADEIILVSSPDVAAVENAKRTQAFIQRINGNLGGLVITKVEEDFDDSIVGQFDTELLGVIPKQEVVSQSTAEGKPLELIAPNSPAARAYRQLEANITNGVLPPGRTERTQAETEPSADSPEPESAHAESPGSGADEPDKADEDQAEAKSRNRGLFGRIASLVT